MKLEEKREAARIETIKPTSFKHNIKLTCNNRPVNTKLVCSPINNMETLCEYDLQHYSEGV